MNSRGLILLMGCILMSSKGRPPILIVGSDSFLNNLLVLMTHPNFGHSVGPRSFCAVFFCVLLPFKKQETNFLFSLVLIGKQDLDFYVFIHIFGFTLLK